MKIAVIGWGSLIWCSGRLRIASRWYKSGPRLPIEFGRVSSDGRLTLVIVPDAKTVQTLWAVSSFEVTSQAVENLQKREGTSRSNIGQLSLAASSERNNTVEVMETWMHEQNLDAAIWTALPPRSSDGSDSLMSPQGAIGYIRGLDSEKRLRAEEYVRNAPGQIETTIRQRLRQEFGWQNNPLSPSLFEDNH